VTFGVVSKRGGKAFGKFYPNGAYPELRATADAIPYPMAAPVRHPRLRRGLMSVTASKADVFTGGSHCLSRIVLLCRLSPALGYSASLLLAQTPPLTPHSPVPRNSLH
jgi:hypothetical protein